MKPRVVAIGGFDPSGRAGVLADVQAISAAGGVPLAVVTCLTAQGRRPLSRPVDPKLLAAQLEAVADAGPVHAVKVGVIPDRAALRVIAAFVKGLQAPTVVDPIRVSSKGLRLSGLDVVDFERLASHHVILTPNHQEAEGRYGPQLLRGFGAIVVKSVAPGEDAVFRSAKRPIRLKGKVLPRSSAHRGTGCRFASVLAVQLANGHTVVHAARAARRAVRKFLSTPILREVS
ncbi:MAG: bifunctional hydroxymethylpyrimidine kinase/phosphomethylpyrimidine kinase [Archangiaceae bacterium]|nr:bifunctional hydroxymethylpyrimidine kinase/phosphomethylpyrimidine kinase [Archangiaceae bacterium]